MVATIIYIVKIKYIVGYKFPYAGKCIMYLFLYYLMFLIYFKESLFCLCVQYQIKLDKRTLKK